ncbi:MAG: glycosyltransferase [Planctomycetaceae bacterium]|nr:glycosyltransferase [Planctomycetaceae bacterium]
MDKPIRVLHVLVCLDSGGVETLLLNFLSRLPERIHFDFLVSHNAKRDELALEKGSKVFVVPREIQVAPWKYPRYISGLLQEYGYHVVHFHRLAFSGSVMKAVKNSGATVRISHCHHTQFQEPGFWKPLIYFLYHSTFNRYHLWKHATHILACSNDAGRFLMGPHWHRSAKCKLLLNGIPLDEVVGRMAGTTRDALCQMYGIPREAIVLGNFSRMSPVKNLPFLLKIFACLAKRDPRYVLFIAGDGALRQQLVSQVQEARLEHRVFMPGYCKNPVELAGRLFDAFCLPSLAEGLPVSLIEAVAGGLHSVCSDTITRDITARFPERITPLSLKAAPDVWADAVEKAFSLKVSNEDGAALVRSASMTIESQLGELIAVYETALRQTEAG